MFVYDGLVRTNEKIYDLLVLGKSLQQTIAGDTKSFPLQYIDWTPKTWLTNNVFTSPRSSWLNDGEP